MELKSGDIILTSTDSIVARFMRMFQSDPVEYGHALMVRNSNDAYEASLYVRIIPLEKIFKKRKHYIILRYKGIEQRHISIMNKALDKLVGNLYSFKRFILQFFDHVFNTNYFTKLDKDTKSQICSSLVAWAYYVATRIKFNYVSWRSTDPDDIFDHCLNNSDEWEVIEKV